MSIFHAALLHNAKAAHGSGRFARPNEQIKCAVRPGTAGGWEGEEGWGGSLRPSGLKAPDREAGGRRDAAGCDRVQTWSGPARAAHSACAIIHTFLIVVIFTTTTTIIIIVVVILTWDGKCSDRNTARFCLVSVNFGVELCVSQVSCIYQSVYKLSCVRAVCCCLPEKLC